jgi:twitching motility protein PilT
MLADGNVSRYLEVVWQNSGTDLLLAAGSVPMVRVDGVLRPIGSTPALDEAQVRDLLAEIVDEAQIARLADELELDFSFSWSGRARVRGNAFHQQDGAAVALRVIPERIPSFEDIGLPPAVQRLASLPQGLVLFTGPTGSGKSTSLASLIEWINVHRACHVITIEDPVEYVHRNHSSVVSQREVGVDTHSFQRALRAALREDPDVILVGEMRDPESIAIALTLAETGHLVFSTLHTNDASQALDRIVDSFDSERQGQIRLQLASVLTAVVAQRLVPRIGGGMAAAFEILLGTSAARNLVREGKTRQLRNVIATSRADGMQTLEHGLSELVRQGIVDYDSAVARAVVPNEVTRADGSVPQRSS